MELPDEVVDDLRKRCVERTARSRPWSGCWPRVASARTS